MAEIKINGVKVTTDNWSEISNAPPIKKGGLDNAIIENDTINNIASGNYSHAEGSNTTAASYAHAEGFSTEASNFAHAEGYNTKATGSNSHAEGKETEAMVVGSHAEGYGTRANGDYSHTEGSGTYTSAEHAHAEGWTTNANGKRSHAEGGSNTASGESAHAEGGYWVKEYNADGTIKELGGTGNTAQGNASHTEGSSTRAMGNQSHTEGYNTRAVGENSHAEGENTMAQKNAHAEGYFTNAQGSQSHTEGTQTQALTWNAHAEGGRYRSFSTSSDSEYNQKYRGGGPTIASGYSSHAEGTSTMAGSDFIFNNTTGEQRHNISKLAIAAHAEGGYTQASGEYSHAEGMGSFLDTNDSEFYIYTSNEVYESNQGLANDKTRKGKLYKKLNNEYEEMTSTQINDYGIIKNAILTVFHKDNRYYDIFITNVNGIDIEFIGELDKNQYHKITKISKQLTTASGKASHAEGIGTVASGDASHAGGIGTIASAEGQTVIGQYNAANNNALFIVGNGGSVENRKNAFMVDKDGNAHSQNGQLVTQGEMETAIAKAQLEGSGVTIDTELNIESGNPISNKAVSSALEDVKTLNNELSQGSWQQLKIEDTNGSQINIMFWGY